MHLLFVCGANVSGSAVAERLARSVLDVWLPGRPGAITVGSAGTSATTGSGVHPLSRGALHARGGSSRDFEARQLTPARLRSADLVLTMTEEQRRVVGVVDRTARGRTFTVREAVALLVTLPPVVGPLGADGDAHARTLVRQLTDRRTSRRTRTGSDDLLDPVGSPPVVHEQVAAQLQGLLLVLLRALVLPEHAAGLWGVRDAAAPAAASAAPAAAPAPGVRSVA